MAKKRKINKRKRSHKGKIIGLFLFVLLAILLAAFVRYQLGSVIETGRSGMKKIPPDVKKVMVQDESKTNAIIVRVPILMYHYVEYVQDKNDTIRESLNINPNVFEAQVKTLQDAGYTFMTAKELGEVLDKKELLPQKPVLLTFDDGHWDFDTVVLPILKKYHVKATAYIISSFIGGSDFMSSSQLQDVVNSGLVDVGAHTVHHVALAGKLSSIVTYEVSQSKQQLEQTYHIQVVSFAYPDGSFDQQAIDAVQQAGFTTAVSTVPGIMQNEINRYFLYRLRPGYRIGQQLLNYLNGNSFRAY